MIYRFILLSDEVENFIRQIDIESDATFLDFQNIILKSVGYSSDELTSFFICNESWEKEQEITAMQMDTGSEQDNYVMDNTHIDDMIEDEGQKLIFVFDPFNERAFFIKLQEIITKQHLKKPVCSRSEGTPPKQILDLDTLTDTDIKNAGNEMLKDEDFYGSDDYNIDELDTEGLDAIEGDDVI